MKKESTAVLVAGLLFLFFLPGFAWIPPALKSLLVLFSFVFFFFGCCFFFVFVVFFSSRALVSFRAAGIADHARNAQ